MLVSYERREAVPMFLKWFNEHVYAINSNYKAVPNALSRHTHTKVTFGERTKSYAV
jgi:hypothetical protein